MQVSNGRVLIATLLTSVGIGVLGCGAAGDADPAGAGGSDGSGLTEVTTDAARLARVKTVFVIVLENHAWADIGGQPSAPYINGTLVPSAANADAYYNPPGLHPSEPNYLWMEAGTNFGIRNNDGPRANHQDTPLHLVRLLDDAGVSWRSYQEDIPGTECPLSNVDGYSPKHNPMVFFDDVTGGLDRNDPGCIAHNRPFAELDADLRAGNVARYNFITPNLCNDMHDSCKPRLDPVAQGDAWLAATVPMILGSEAFADDGALFITWDEGGGGVDGPLGMMVLSPLAKAGGYHGTTRYTHSALLRTVQAVFSVGPLLGDAAHSSDLSDLFAPVL